MGTSRRSYLTGAAGSAFALTGLAGCLGGGGGSGSSTETTVTPTEDDPLVVSVFGGVFKEVLDEHLIQPFREETGIPVESQAQGGAANVLPKLESAVRGGNAPVDVADMSAIGTLRGRHSDLWMSWSDDEFDNVPKVSDDLITRASDSDEIIGVGSQAWFINLVSNTEVLADPPTSWTALWDSQYESQLGLLTPAQTSFLLDITAATHFDGEDLLSTKDGITQVFEKLAAVKPQSSLWYTNEANFEAQLKSGDAPAGMLYNDVTVVMEENGAPVTSTFVDEGSLLDSGRWVAPRTSDKRGAIVEFIDYASRPEVQDTVSRNLYTAPTVEQQHSSLDDQTFEKIVGPGLDAAIVPNYEMYIEREQFINQQWNELIIQS
ncbi:extracellular solute-binding protein [Halarchaeum nitratireducens]|uniref:ABC transporter substrate-binding protein n=1 Tax=Halarchaeum nitratireducens TaxID=489913 RepID=A0A830G9B1_9EURY|nr:extracellular solute-binding protein [Halarchaeum nitratireducens]GGN10951.1 ABC transporter substrate-binding protein [Halarchaeum nitratireducens]